jgi:hypothetical protein
MTMTFDFSGEAIKRISRLATISQRDPALVIEAALGLWEQSLLTSMPPDRRSAYLVNIVEYTVVTTPPPKPQGPRRVERDAYVAYEDYGDGIV